MRGVIFDLDGTLVDSASDIHAASNVLLTELGHPTLPLDLVRSFIGNGIPKLVERVMAASNIPLERERHWQLVQRFQQAYADKPVALTEFYPGAERALEKLKSDGFSLGIWTNKAYGLTRQVLEGLGLDQTFDSVIGGDSLPEHKPDPAPFYACRDAMGVRDVGYVGDSEVDAATARAAGVKFALFTEGYRKTPIAAIPHDVSFASFDVLPDLMVGLLESIDA